MIKRQEIVEELLEIAGKSPDKIVIGNEDETLTYRNFINQVEDCTKVIKPFLKQPNCVIGLALKNGPQSAAFEIAAWASGGIAMSLPPLLKKSEAEVYLSIVKPDLLVIDDQVEQCQWVEASGQTFDIINSNGNLIQAGSQQPNKRIDYKFDPIQIQFTSGSTGIPKALVFSSAALQAGLHQTQNWYREIADYCPSFCPLPQHHAMGRAVVFESIWAGRGIIMANKNLIGDHKTQIEAFNCATIIGSPLYLRMGLQLEVWDKLNRINRFIVGTAETEPELVQSIQEKLPNVQIDIRYGVSECFGPLSKLELPPGSGTIVPGNVGQPLINNRLKTTHDNRRVLSASSPAIANASLFQGKLQEVAGEDGYIETGDNGYVNNDGSVIISGRSNLFIKHRGLKVDPREIEATIIKNKRIQEVVVVGVPDKQVGERIVAAVKIVSGAEIDLSDIYHLCKQNLSDYKIPNKIVELNLIPKKPSGKPDRAAILNSI